MKETYVSDDAENDLLEIWIYISRDSYATADKYIDKIKAKYEILRKYPSIGRIRSEYSPSLRSFPVNRYIIFYRILEDGIEIVRVLHCARDLNSIFLDHSSTD